MVEAPERPNCWAFVTNTLGLTNGERYVEPPTLDAVQTHFQIVKDPSQAHAIGFLEDGGNTIIHGGIVLGSLDNITSVLPDEHARIRNHSVNYVFEHYSRDPDVAPLRFVLLKLI